jgi:hypothetical protein
MLTNSNSALVKLGQVLRFADQDSWDLYHRFVYQDAGEPEFIECCLKLHQEGHFGDISEEMESANTTALNTKSGVIVSKWQINQWVQLEIVTDESQNTTKMYLKYLVAL